MLSLQLTSLQGYLSRLMTLGGVRAAALVDPDSGMVILHEGDFENFDRLAEVAVDFWRLHLRHQESLSTLGALTVITISYEGLSVRLQPTSPGLVGNLIAVMVLDWSSSK